MGIPGYTAGVKTAVSIPDDVFARADAVAAQRGVSRSQLYTEALRRLLDSDDEITRRLDDVYADASNRTDGLDAITSAGRRLLRSVEW